MTFKIIGNCDNNDIYNGLDSDSLGGAYCTDLSIATYQPTSETDPTLVNRYSGTKTQITNWITAIHAKGLKCTMQIFGNSSLHWDKIIDDTTPVTGKRAVFVANILQLLTDIGADGMLFDWEDSDAITLGKYNGGTMSPTDTSFTIDTDVTSTLAAGEEIMVGSENMKVSSISGGGYTINVVSGRGKDGTTAISHSGSFNIYKVKMNTDRADALLTDLYAALNPTFYIDIYYGKFLYNEDVFCASPSVVTAKCRLLKVGAYGYRATGWTASEVETYAGYFASASTHRTAYTKSQICIGIGGYVACGTGSHGTIAAYKEMLALVNPTYTDYTASITTIYSAIIGGTHTHGGSSYTIYWHSPSSVRAVALWAVQNGYGAVALDEMYEDEPTDIGGRSLLKAMSDGYQDSLETADYSTNKAITGSKLLMMGA